MFIKLLSSVTVLFLLVIPGFLLSKSKIEGTTLAKGLSNLILYGTQPALLLYSFLVIKFEMRIFKNCLLVLCLTMLAHGLFYFLASFLYKKAGKDHRIILRYASVFSNAGYMGIPLINFVLGNEATIYASAYIVGFNVFSFSLGFLLYSEDRKYISLKKILINPASIPILIAFFLFSTRLNTYIPDIFIETIEMLKNTVAPLSMTVVGLRLPELNLKSAFRDKYLYELLSVRLFIFPAILWAIMFLLYKLGVLTNSDVMSAVLICSATPCATATSMLAEKFNRDAVYAGKLVSISTILSVVTMPIVALLLNIK